MRFFIISTLFLLFGAGISFAQESKNKIPREILTIVEQVPEFPGGPAALNAFLAKNLRYPKSASKNNIEGRVIARFVVETDGSIGNPEIINSVSLDCDKETLRVINKMPRWNPGRQNGVAAAVYYTLPVSFKLH
ncbi:MAG: energy transducer TonB [Taibaiella sp.]|jgi:protein TonB